MYFCIAHVSCLQQNFEREIKNLEHLFNWVL
jgi:hypothetical protein